MENKPVNIVQLFESAARKYPGHTAIIDKNRMQISYADMLAAVQNKAAEMRSKGLQKGDRVLVFVPIGIDLYVNVLATLYLGAAVVFVDEWTDLERLRTCCAVADCKAIVLPRRLLLLKYLLGPLRKIPLRIESGLREGYPVFAPVEVDTKEQTAIITFSSGTTGTPKAADRTHEVLFEQFQALGPIRNAQPEEVNLTTLPIVLLLNLASGCTSVIADYKPRKPLTFLPEKIDAQIAEHAISSFTLSPYFALALAHHRVYSEVKRLVIGGACMFPKEVKKIKEAFPNANIILVYGSTEAEPISTTTPDEFLEKHQHPQPGLYLGKPVPETETLVYPFGGLEGELCVDGPHVLKRYFNSPDEGKRVVIEGRSWLKTGDAVHLSSENELFLLGRQSNVALNPSQRIFPTVLEMLARSCAGVRFAALKKSQEEAVLFVESDSTFDPSELRQLLDKNGFAEVRIKEVRSIPRDKRHFSRPDYGEL